MSDAPHIAANIERFMGFAEEYDRYRPAAAPIIPAILTELAAMPRPHRVVDIGSGTGLSTRAWLDLADEVIGVEPSDDMRRQAERVTPEIAYIRYQKGLSTATGLPDACADIVTVSQALHWMEPVGTFSEIARLLRPGGVFAAIDNDWPPTYNLEVEAIDEAFHQNADRLITDGQLCARREAVAQRRTFRADAKKRPFSLHQRDRGASRRIGQRGSDRRAGDQPG